MQYRKDFDYFAECGIEICNECEAVFYPMEIENNECPDCIIGKTIHKVLSSTFSFGECPDPIIQQACLDQCENGYPMTIKDPVEWGWIATAVNQGIDSHLEALTNRSTFNNGTCLIHPEELHVLCRRLLEMGWNETEDQIQGRADSPHSLRSAILTTLDIEEI